MKSTLTILWQALLFALVLTLAHTFIRSFGEERGFFTYLLTWATLIQFVLMWLISYFFIHNRNKKRNNF